MLTALKCPQCYAALPQPPVGARFLQCAFCGMTAQLGEGVAPPTPAPDRPPHVPHVEPPSQDPRLVNFQAMGETFAKHRRAGVPFTAAIEQAAVETLSAFGDARPLARAVTNLALEFAAETGARLEDDSQVISRLGEGFNKANIELRHTDKTEINLPFLGVGPSGPVHMNRTVTAADLQHLTSRIFERAAPPPPPPPPAPEPPKKKKGWFW